MIYADSLTFPELIASVEPVVTRQGYLIGGKDRSAFLSDSGGLTAAWKAWQHDCKTSNDLYPKVQEYFQRTKHLSKPPESEKDLAPNGGIDYEARKIAATGINPPRFTWSPSSLMEFGTCPAKMAASRYYNVVPYEESEATIWGTRVHKQAENFINGDTIDDTEAFAPVEKWVKALVMQPGEKFSELKLGLREDYSPHDFDGACGRMIIDLVILNGDSAFLCDWKTGKIKDDETQLLLNCFALALHYPHLQNFKYRYIWIKDDKTTGGELTRVQLGEKAKELVSKIKRMKQAWDECNFTKIKNGLCRQYCGYLACEHNGRR